MQSHSYKLDEQAELIEGFPFNEAARVMSNEELSELIIEQNGDRNGQTVEPNENATKDTNELVNEIREKSSQKFQLSFTVKLSPTLSDTFGGPNGPLACRRPARPGKSRSEWPR